MYETILIGIGVGLLVSLLTWLIKKVINLEAQLVKVKIVQKIHIKKSNVNIDELKKELLNNKDNGEL